MSKHDENMNNKPSSLSWSRWRDQVRENVRRSSSHDDIPRWKLTLVHDCMFKCESFVDLHNQSLKYSYQNPHKKTKNYMLYWSLALVWSDTPYAKYLPPHPHPHHHHHHTTLYLFSVPTATTLKILYLIILCDWSWCLNYNHMLYLNVSFHDFHLYLCKHESWLHGLL
jgi:hypothetical protein